MASTAEPECRTAGRHRSRPFPRRGRVSGRHVADEVAEASARCSTVGVEGSDEFQVLDARATRSPRRSGRRLRSGACRVSQWCSHGRHDSRCQRGRGLRREGRATVPPPRAHAPGRTRSSSLHQRTCQVVICHRLPLDAPMSGESVRTRRRPRHAHFVVTVCCATRLSSPVNPGPQRALLENESARQSTKNAVYTRLLIRRLAVRARRGAPQF